MRHLALVALVASACGDNVVVPIETPPPLVASVVGKLAPDAFVSIAALDHTRIAVARATVMGDAFCPDCVDLDPSQCPAICKRTRISVGILGKQDERLVFQVFPRSFDHDVNQLATVALGDDRIGVAWLDCDNSRCGAIASKQSCSAHYTTVDLETGALGTVATLYENRFAKLQLVANSSRMLAVTGMTYGAFGTGVRAALFDHAGALQGDWFAIGGVDALSPAATAIGTGFAIAVDDRRPRDLPPDIPCTASCECGGTINVDPIKGGLYVYEIDDTGIAHVDPVAIGLAQDGHLDGGHYHAREVLAIMQRDGDLVVAAGQAIDQDAELFVGRRNQWSVQAGFDSPSPMWIGVMGVGDTLAWLGSQPQGEGAATVNRIVAGTSTGSELALTEPLDSYVLQAAPFATRIGIPKTFLLRGLFGREGTKVFWTGFEIVEVRADTSP